MKRKIDWLITNLVLLAGVTLVIAINLNSRLVEQEKTIKDMQWTIQEHELSIQRFAEPKHRTRGNPKQIKSGVPSAGTKESRSS